MRARRETLVIPTSGTNLWNCTHPPSFHLGPPTPRPPIPLPPPAKPTKQRPDASGCLISTTLAADPYRACLHSTQSLSRATHEGAKGSGGGKLYARTTTAAVGNQDAERRGKAMP